MNRLFPFFLAGFLAFVLWSGSDLQLAQEQRHNARLNLEADRDRVQAASQKIVESTRDGRKALRRVLQSRGPERQAVSESPLDRASAAELEALAQRCATRYQILLEELSDTQQMAARDLLAERLWLLEQGVPSLASGIMRGLSSEELLHEAAACEQSWRSLESSLVPLLGSGIGERLMRLDLVETLSGSLRSYEKPREGQPFGLDADSSARFRSAMQEVLVLEEPQRRALAELMADETIRSQGTGPEFFSRIVLAGTSEPERENFLAGHESLFERIYARANFLSSDQLTALRRIKSAELLSMRASMKLLKKMADR